MKRSKYAVAFALTGVVLAIGCGSTPVIQQMGLRTSVGTGSMAPSSGCMLTSETRLTIGDPTDNIIRNQDGFGGGTVKFDCSVIPAAGGAFQVTARAELLNVPDNKRGTFSVNGLIFPKAMQPMSPNITVSITTQGETFKQNNCNFYFKGIDRTTFATCDAPTRDTGDNTLICTANPNMDVAAGKVWGSVVCETAKDDAANPPRTCKTTATFRFENCTQQTN